jgi:LysM repeat protein
MIYPHQPENIKVCPGCGTSLIDTAKRCAVCGYSFTASAPETLKDEPGPRRRQGFMPVTISLPVLLGLIMLLLAMNTLVILGLQKRDQTKALVNAAQSTATFIATTFVSPTPSPTLTRTPAPPTETPVVDIEYVVVSGDSCLSIAKHFNLYLNSILLKNDLDCSVLKIGTVLKIPHPTATPEATSTSAP